MIAFLTILAWIYGSLALVLIIVRILLGLAYTELDELCDRLQGIKRNFSIEAPTIQLIICIVWIYTH